MKERTKFGVVLFHFKGSDAGIQDSPDFEKGHLVKIVEEVNQDWCMVEVLSTGSKGIIPVNHIRCSSNKIGNDEISQNMNKLITNMHKDFKSYFKHYDRHDMEENLLENFQKSWDTLTNYYSGRRKILPRLSSEDQKTFTEEMINKTRDIPVTWRHRAIVDFSARSLGAYNLKFSHLHDVYLQRVNTRSEIIETKEKMFWSLYFCGSNMQGVAFSEREVDFYMTIWQPAEGFVTEFYVQRDFTDVKTLSSFAAKRINIPETETGYLVILLVIKDSKTKANKCEALGTIKLEDLGTREDEVKIYIHPNNSSEPFSVRDQIKRQVESGEKLSSSFLYFKARLLDFSSLKDDEFIMKRNMPVMISEVTNSLYITILRAKITENFSVFGDTGDVAIEAHVCDSTGSYISLIDLSGSNTGYYNSLALCQYDWTEIFSIRIPENWEDLHLVFKIYKYEEKKKGKLVAFSYLPLLPRSEGNLETILRDLTRKLLVFQVSNNKEPFCEDYLQEEYMIHEEVLDKETRRSSIKRQRNKQFIGPKFMAKKDDFLEIQTKLRSTIITEDVSISRLLHLNIHEVDEHDLHRILENFVTFRSQDAYKKLLFLPTLLDNLWHILQHFPKKADWILFCFFETIHQLAVGSSGELNEFHASLHQYLNNRFSSQEFYPLLIPQMINLMSGKGEVTAIVEKLKRDQRDPFITVVKSFEFVFKFTEKSFCKFGSKMDPGLFEAFMQHVLYFFKNDAQEQKRHGFLYKELIKPSCLSICEKLLSKPELSKYLTELLKLDNMTLVFRLDTCINILQTECLITSEIWSPVYEAIRARILNGFQFINTKSDLFIRLIRALQCLVNIGYKQKVESKNRDITKTFIHHTTLKRFPSHCKEASKAKACTLKLFVCLLEDIDADTIDGMDNPVLMDILATIQILFDCEVFPAMKIKCIKIATFRIIQTFLSKLSDALMSRAFNKEMYSEFIITITNIMRDSIWAENHEGFEDEHIEVLKSVRDSLIFTFESFIRRIRDVDKMQLVFSGKKEPLINHILDTCMIQNPDLQQLSMRLIVEFFLAEYRTSKNNTMYELYDWLVDRFLKFYTKKSLLVEGGALTKQFGQQFRKSTYEHLLNSNITCDVSDQGDSDELCNKFKMITESVTEIIDAVVDAVKVLQFCSIHDHSSTSESSRYDFGLVTSEYRLYEKMRGLEKKAREHGLIEPDLVSRWFNLYKHILFHLYDIYTSRSKALECAFTLQELESLLPWSTELLDDKELKMKIGAWWRTEITDNSEVMEKLKRSNKNVESMILKRGQLPDDDSEWGKTKIKLTYTDVKEIIEKLAIVKFEQACGFECSIDLMDKLIHRYKNVDIDFKKLATVLKNLSEIYEAQAAFNANKDKGKKYILRGPAYSKTNELEKSLTEWFQGAKVVYTLHNLRNSETVQGPVIFLQKVDYVMTHMDCYEKLTLPFQVVEYKTKNITNVFVTKEQISKAGDIRVTLNICAFELPGMVSWAEVVSDKVKFVIKPIVSQLSMMQMKNMELQKMMEELNSDPKSHSMTLVCMSLQGVIISAVNGGIPELRTLFLNDEYVAQNPEDKIYVEDFENEIFKQNRYVEELLKIHRRSMDPSMKGLQVEMENEFEKRKKESRKTGDLNFKVPALDMEANKQVAEFYEKNPHYSI